MIRIGSLAVVVLVWTCVPDPGPSDRSAEAYVRVLAAEDARPAGGAQLSLLVSSAEHPDPLVRLAGVRALGRLERSELGDEIAGSLDDASPAVRAAAPLALAQAVRADDGGAVLEILLERTTREADPTVRGALGRALGRLRLAPRARDRALRAMLQLSRRGGTDAPLETLVGVALGFESLVRSSDGSGIGREMAERLEVLAAYRRDAHDDPEAARVRALALATLGAARRLSLGLVEMGLEDPADEVRRVAVRHFDVVVPSRRMGLLRRAVQDPSVRVAIEAVRFLAARSRNAASCALLIAAARPESPIAVRIAALDALGQPCPDTEQGAILLEAATSPDIDSGAWQPAVQALESLARIDPTAAERLLSRYVEHADPFVRAHAARVAALLRERQALGELSMDRSPNVRTAALEGLFDLEGHAIDALVRAHLASDDPQLLLTAARLLEGSQSPDEAASTALAAFERISAVRRETWRDPRRALLERVAEHGDVRFVGRMRPYLSDYDPVVARDVAALLEAWTGEPLQPTPVRLARAPLPSLVEIEELRRTTVTLHMRGLAGIVIRPFPDVAPTNAYRFVRLARSGSYDGLTFHRWVANLVIQGGSPAANEYQGDRLYTRDEIGASNWRGTVGVSTRGRDTGDGQIFINLSDNVALDPDYTVFGVVTEGLDVVDSVLEGAVIERAEVRVGS